MVLLYSVMVSIISVLAPTQSPDLSQQGVLDELKGMHAALEKVEKGQRMLVALMRIQIDEGRLVPLEIQRQQLADRERALDDEAQKLLLVLQREASGQVSAATSDPTQSSPIRIRYDDAARKVEDVRRTLRTVEDSISAIRTRIATWEKYFEDLSK